MTAELNRLRFKNSELWELGNGDYDYIGKWKKTRGITVSVSLQPPVRALLVVFCNFAWKFCCFLESKLLETLDSIMSSQPSPLVSGKHEGYLIGQKMKIKLS